MHGLGGGSTDGFGAKGHGGPGVGLDDAATDVEVEFDRTGGVGLGRGDVNADVVRRPREQIPVWGRDGITEGEWGRRAGGGGGGLS